MPLPEKKFYNQAIVDLKDVCGWTLYAIAKAFGETDKRNIVRKYKRFKEKYKRSEEINLNNN